MFLIVTAGLGAAAAVGVVAGLGFGPHALGLFALAVAMALLATSNRALGVIDYVIVLSVCGFIVINRGWSYIGLSAGGLPLFIGEATLLAGLFTTLAKWPEKPRPWTLTAAAWLVPYFLLGAYHMLSDVRTAGLEAVRNFSIVYYVALVPAGYFVAVHARRRGRLLHLLGITLVIQLFYSALYPWRGWVLSFTPHSPEGTPYLGNHASCYTFNVMAIAFVYLLGKPVLGLNRNTRAALAVFGALVLAAVQSRAGFVAAMVAVTAVVALGRRRLARSITAAIIASAVVLTTLSLVGTPVKGERGSLSVGNIAFIVQSIFFKSDADDMVDFDLPEGDEETARGMVGTRDWRVTQWKRIIADTMATTAGTLTGRGFSEVFVPANARGEHTIRHPHNVFVSVFARTGLFGLASFALFYLTLVYQLVRAVRRRPPEAEPARDLLLFLVVFAVVVPTVGFFSPLHNSPHFGVPLHFLGGVACAVIELDRRGMLTAPGSTQPSPPQTGTAQGVPTDAQRPRSR